MSVVARRVLVVLFACVSLTCVGLFDSVSVSAEVTHDFKFSFEGGETPEGPFEGDLGAVAIDQTSGDVYVDRYNNYVVDKFDVAGKYLGEITGAAVPQKSLGLEAESGMEVDNSSGPNKGDLYVSGTENGVVYRFNSLGKLISELNGSGTPAGSFVPAGVAVDASGNLFVADRANDVIDEFDAAGAYTGQLASPEIIDPGTIAVDSSDNVYVANVDQSVVKLEPGGATSVLDINSSSSVAVNLVTDDVYVSEADYPSFGRIVEFDQSGKRLGGFGEERLAIGRDVAVNGDTDEVYVANAGEVHTANGEFKLKLVDVFGAGLVIPDGVTLPASSIQPSSATLNGTINPDGIQVTGCEFEYGTSISYGQNAACAQSAPSIGAGTSVVPVSVDLSSLEADTEYHYRIAVSNANGTNHGVDSTFVTPGPPRIDAESVSDATQETAVLDGQVNPFGFDTTYRFEYGTTRAYGVSIPVPDVDIGSETTEQSVSQSISKLQPAVTYHYRLVASSSQGIVDGADQEFTTVPSADIDSEYVTNVASSSATIDAQINPLDSSTEYRLEYGPSTSYGQTISGSVGDGTTNVLIARHLGGLSAATTYHYRIVTHNSLGTVEGADRTFTTQPAGNNVFALPDGRAWELVSPADKSGAVIENIEEAQAASDGSGIYYTASAPIGEGITGHVGQNITGVSSAAVLSRRGADGWRTIDISPKQTLPPDGVGGGELAGSAEAFYLFSPDLSSVAFEPRGPVAPQSEGITERTLYLRDDENGTYLPLVNPGNVPPETKYGPIKVDEDMSFVAATPDLAHVVLSSGVPLTSEAERVEKSGGEPAQSLYEWTAGKLQLVNIPQAPQGVNPEAYFGSSAITPGGATPDGMSSDGRWVVFRYGNDFGSSPVTYYVRDMVEKRTVRFGPEEGFARFETMSSDGSKIFYLEPEDDNDGIETEGELYVFDPATGTDLDLTATHLDGESNAEVENKLVGTSEDGSVVYFVAKGVLASGAVKGANNLYVLRDEGSAWSTTFIATLSSEDGKDWQSFNNFRELEPITSRVSPNGRYLAFMSENSLTGYDNHDAVSGEPDEETYLYDATANRLACVSCDPSGARPVGILDQHEVTTSRLIDFPQIWDGNEEQAHSNAGRGHWLASMLPPAWHVDWKVASYQPRSLSDSGRLFFESTDALVPQDTNGLADVYEYEPVGTGSCSQGSVTFSGRTVGCVSLISSGQSASESVFFDASETGDDVFFITTGRLVSEDTDTSYDVYDAHVCTTAVPCVAAPVSSPPCTSGDSCKAAPSPQPAIFGATPSATFSGVGNVSEETAVKTAKHKSKTKAKKSKAKSKKKKKRKKGRSKSGKAGRSSRTDARTTGRDN